MRIFPIFVKKTIQQVAGTVTAIFNEKVQRAEGAAHTIRVSDTIQRGESEILKTVALSDGNSKSDAYRIPSVTVTGADTERRAEATVESITISGGASRGDVSTTVLLYQTPGTYTWVAPFTGTVKVELWGGGGGGGGNTVVTGAGGGGSGAYARLNAFAVTKGTSYTIVIAGQANQQADGQSSTFNATSCVAAGGKTGLPGTATTQGAGGAGATAAASTGDVKIAGSAGGGGGTGTTNGGGGGGSPGDTSGGGAGNSNGTGGTAGSAGGAVGGTGATTIAGATAGGAPGAGGGGTSALQSGSPIGNGGYARLTYTF